MPTVDRAARTTLALVTAFLLPACAGAAPTTDAASTPTASPGVRAPALQVDVEYPRYLHAQRQVEVIVVNQGGEPATIAHVALDSPLFRPQPPTVRDTVLEPGRRVDLKAAFGAPDCTATGDLPASARLGIRQPGGDVAEVVFELPTGPLERIHEAECREQAVAAAVELRLSPQYEEVDGALEVELVAERAAWTGPVLVTVGTGNVIFTVRPRPPASELSLRLPQELHAARLPLEIRATRCDSHAVGESKKSYLFPLWVQLGDDPEQPVTLDAAPRLRPALDRAIQACLDRAPRA